MTYLLWSHTKYIIILDVKNYNVFGIKFEVNVSAMIPFSQKHHILPLS